MTVTDPLLWHASGTTHRGGLRSGDPAINRCRQAPDRTARRGDTAFVGWCWSAARCCSLRSELRSSGGSPTPCGRTKAGAPLTPRSTQPLPPASDTAHDPAPHGAPGARLSSALSSPLSSARRRILGSAPRHPMPDEAPRCGGGVSDDLARWAGVSFRRPGAAPKNDRRVSDRLLL